MNYHLFQKNSQSVFSKKIKSKSKSQNRERMSWTLYNFPLHCIVSYEVHIYQISKVAYICIPKNHVNCVDFLHLMSHLLEFGMTDPLNESISCFLKRVDPWVQVPSPLEGYTPSPSEGYTPSPSEDYTSSLLEGYTPSPSEDCTSSPSEGYTPSPSENCASSPSEGCTPSPSKGDTSWTSEGCTLLPSESCTPSPSKD